MEYAQINYLRRSYSYFFTVWKLLFLLWEKKLSWIAFSVTFVYQKTVVIVHLENNKLQSQISLNIIWICDGTSCADCYIAWAEVLSIAVLLLLQERAISWRNHFLLTFRITGCLRRIRFHLPKHWVRFS